jgi:hypothetical protein
MDDTGVSLECANSLILACEESHVTSRDGAVDLSLTREDIGQVLGQAISGSHSETFHAYRESIIDVILQSRYKNLQSLLKAHISEEAYIGIVRNQILVDVQGEDLLYQIFTSKILFRQAGEEAPFFEFIQRVCSERTDEYGRPSKVKPGCGGFGYVSRF